MKSSSSRQKLIEAACGILASQSFSSLSIDRITERAGLSRRTFFLHFASKDDLLTAVLQEVQSIRLAKLEHWSAEAHPGLTLPERIHRYFDSIIRETHEPGWRGSIFIRLSAEFAELRGHPIHQVVERTYRDMAAWFETEFRRDGYPEPALRAEEMLVLLSGLLVRQLVAPSPSQENAVLRMLPRLLERRHDSTAAAAAEM